MPTMTGGAKLQAYLRDLAKKVAEPATLEVGIMEGATYPDGTPVALVAVVQEFGAPAKGIPPRPFMRGTVQAHSGEWGKKFAGLLKAKDYDAKVALDTMGQIIKDQVVQTITDFTSPPNAPETIKRKGFNKPLIQHGDMRNAVAWRVKDEAPGE